MVLYLWLHSAISMPDYVCVLLSIIYKIWLCGFVPYFGIWYQSVEIPLALQAWKMFYRQTGCGCLTVSPLLCKPAFIMRF